ncbi:MAG: glutaredoxin-like protein [Bacillota bacterium]|nr:MAG: glutaredoxin-like protein [Bacillota bacterium]
MEELKGENENYAAIEVALINEKLQPELAAQYDYYLVPTYFINANKVHEGAASKETVRNVFEKFLAQS